MQGGFDSRPYRRDEIDRPSVMYSSPANTNRTSWTSLPGLDTMAFTHSLGGVIMTQWGYEDNDNAGQDNATELDGPKALRDAYAALKKQNEDTMAMVSELLAEKKQTQLSNVFESLGVPGAKDLYQGDADPEKAKAWVQSMQGVFGAGNQGGTPPVADSQPALAPDAQVQYQRMTEAGQTGQPMGNMDAAFAAVGDATDLNSLIAGFQNATRTTGG